MIDMKRLMFIVFAFSALMASAQPKLFVPPNEPLGEGKGLHPGRVVWVHHPGVAFWDGETGLWVEDRWNDQQKADEMIQTIPYSMEISSGSNPERSRTGKKANPYP